MGIDPQIQTAFDEAWEKAAARSATQQTRDRGERFLLEALGAYQESNRSFFEVQEGVSILALGQALESLPEIDGKKFIFKASHEENGIRKFDFSLIDREGEAGHRQAKYLTFTVEKAHFVQTGNLVCWVSEALVIEHAPDLWRGQWSERQPAPLTAWGSMTSAIGEWVSNISPHAVEYLYTHKDAEDLDNGRGGSSPGGPSLKP